ncbi:hypothetical protein DI005_34275 [Prauserella sp. PE36]|uniref:Uncharacterized protein n=1 Tax=Prauserella endophytica TaxID=1592324 RepID=A0ABY2RT45_9PSEU|nr:MULTISPECIES: hypothetical protein [Prauserella]PXY17272.1 hypothetical protein BAY59_37620 [Prauserella coralliicola]RBM11395.1 hypothetical protein DI005_34275 [Prauserella sp. PE36]TKG59472.1 hypothetical protein FCN18_36760 [Prauserella endophytica]
MTQFQPQPPAPRSRRAPLLLGLLVGVLLGGGGVGLGWLLSSSGDAEGAQADATAACDLVARTPHVDLEADLTGLYRLSAASSLAGAAAEADGAYEPVNEALRDVVNYVQRRMDAESEGFRESMAAARAACAEV